MGTKACAHSSIYQLGWRFAERFAPARSENAHRCADCSINDLVSDLHKTSVTGFVANQNRARKWTTTSISAVWGNMSSGVTDSITNFSCKSFKSRASVGGLQ